MLAGFLLGLSLIVLTADKVAVLSLEGSVPDLPTARENFALAVQSSVGLPVQPADGRLGEVDPNDPGRFLSKLSVLLSTP